MRSFSPPAAAIMVLAAGVVVQSSALSAAGAAGDAGDAGEGQSITISDVLETPVQVAETNLAVNTRTGDVAVIWTEWLVQGGRVLNTWVRAAIVRRGSDGGYTVGKPRDVPIKRHKGRQAHIVYNPDDNEFLVAYTHYLSLSGNSRWVYTRRMSATGRPRGAPVLVTPEDRWGWRPRLAFLPGDERAGKLPRAGYLMIWNRKFNSADLSISGVWSRTLDHRGRPDGTALQASQPFLQTAKRCGSNYLWDFFRLPDGDFLFSQSKTGKKPNPAVFATTIDTSGAQVEEAKIVGDDHFSPIRLAQIGPDRFVGAHKPKNSFKVSILGADFRPLGKPVQAVSKGTASATVVGNGDGGYVLGSFNGYFAALYGRSVSSTGELGDDQMLLQTDAGFVTHLEAAVLPDGRIFAVWAENPGRDRTLNQVRAYVFDPSSM